MHTSRLRRACRSRNLADDFNNYRYDAPSVDSAAVSVILERLNLRSCAWLISTLTRPDPQAQVNDTTAALPPQAGHGPIFDAGASAAMRRGQIPWNSATGGGSRRVSFDDMAAERGIMPSATAMPNGGGFDVAWQSADRDGSDEVGSPASSERRL